MKKYKYLCIGIVLTLFILFSRWNMFKTTSFDVIKVISPYQIVLDKNYDSEGDEAELSDLLSGYEVVTRDNSSKFIFPDEYSKFSFVFMTEKYVNELLSDKKVEIRKENGKNVLYISGLSYISIMQKSGFLFDNGKPANIEAFNRRLEQIKKSKFKIYNLKSNVYHSPECEYGQKAKNYLFLPKNQLPKGAKACPYCHKKHLSADINKNGSRVKAPDLVFTSGAITVFLNDYTQHLIPNRSGNTKICMELIKQINNAKSTIDIAAYGYDSVPAIEKAIKNAISRGVKIRLVHDIDSNDSNIYKDTKYFASLIKNTSCDNAPAGLKNSVLYTNSIMHNKFYIFDNSVVITGSANLSYTDMSDYNSNCVLLIKSRTIARIYTDEFEQMYNSKFHNLKTKILNKENISLGNSCLSVYFSPTDNIINSVIVPLINCAKSYIYIPTFLITDSNIANALISAKKRGVDIKIIVDATNAKNTHSKHKILRQNGIQVKTENYAGKLHSKSIIIDDKYSIIGSMNFSKSGNSRNDENVVLLKDISITKFYKKYFIYLWSRINNYWLTHDVSAESVYSIGSCNDKIDNDYDGLIDFNDNGCKFIPKNKNLLK